MARGGGKTCFPADSSRGRGRRMMDRAVAVVCSRRGIAEPGHPPAGSRGAVGVGCRAPQPESSSWARSEKSGLRPAPPRPQPRFEGVGRAHFRVDFRVHRAHSPPEVSLLPPYPPLGRASLGGLATVALPPAAAVSPFLSAAAMLRDDGDRYGAPRCRCRRRQCRGSGQGPRQTPPAKIYP